MKYNVFSLSILFVAGLAVDADARRGEEYNRSNTVTIQGETATGEIVSGTATNRQLAQKRANDVCRKKTQKPCVAYF